MSSFIIALFTLALVSVSVYAITLFVLHAVHVFFPSTWFCGTLGWHRPAIGTVEKDNGSVIVYSTCMDCDQEIKKQYTFDTWCIKDDK